MVRSNILERMLSEQLMDILNCYRDNNKQRISRKQEMENRNSHFALVSIIVTTKNEEKNIANCLRSIRDPTNSINPINFINSAVDNTVKIAKRFTDKV